MKIAWSRYSKVTPEGSLVPKTFLCHVEAVANTLIHNTFQLGTRLRPWVLDLGMKKAAWCQKSFYAKVEPVANTLHHNNFNLTLACCCPLYPQCHNSRKQAGVKLKFL